MFILLAYLGTSLAAVPDLRVVDRVIVGNARSEQEHAYAGEGASNGIAQPHGWMRYALAVFDDTEVTIACTFGGSRGPRKFELVVENKVIATSTFNSSDSATVEFRVPLAITAGRTNILVVLRAADGPTPQLLALRSVQDHNE